MLSKDSMVKQKCTEEIHRQWSQGNVSQGAYRDAVWMCRDKIRKSKTQFELNLARDTNNNKDQQVKETD